MKELNIGDIKAVSGGTAEATNQYSAVEIVSTLVGLSLGGHIFGNICMKAGYPIQHHFPLLVPFGIAQFLGAYVGYQASQYFKQN